MSAGFLIIFNLFHTVDEGRKINLRLYSTLCLVLLFTYKVFLKASYFSVAVTLALWAFVGFVASSSSRTGAERYQGTLVHPGVCRTAEEPVHPLVLLTVRAPGMTECVATPLPSLLEGVFLFKTRWVHISSSPVHLPDGIFLHIWDSFCNFIELL